MADLKISELSALAGSNLVAADELAIVDDSASETKKITVSDLIANGVTVISDDTIPGAKILFGAGDIATAALADAAVTTAKVADDAITAAKLGNESTVDLVTTLPGAGGFTGQLALDTDDNKLYIWDGSAWQSLKAAGSVNTVSGSTTGEINIVSSVSGDTVTLSATIDDTTSANQFLAGPTGAAGAVGYRVIDGSDLPVATSSAKGGVVVNGEGLRMDVNTIEVDNDITASATHHVVTYNAKGLITGGRVLAASDLPIATTSAVGGVIPSTGLTVDGSGNLTIDNSVTADTYTKVTVAATGLVTAGSTLAAGDLPNHSADLLTSGNIPLARIADNLVTGAKLADYASAKIGETNPTADYIGQLFFNPLTRDLSLWDGNVFQPIGISAGEIVFAGTYNATTNLLSSVTSDGTGAGFVVGQALPAASGTNKNFYVVVDVGGTGTSPAPAVALAPPDFVLSTGTEYKLIDVSETVTAQVASNVGFTPVGTIAANNVQTALAEVDTEKVAKSGDTMTGDLTLNDANVVFEGATENAFETTLTVVDPTADRTITLADVSGTVVTTGDTGTVTSTMLTDGTIVNADINASAEIAVSKLANGTARQLLQTDAGGTGVEFTSNVDVPGTLDVTGAATLDSSLDVTGLISADGKVSFPLGSAAAPSLLPGADTNTGIFSPGADQLAITTAGTQRVTVDSSGNVGIGTSSPAALLNLASDGPRLRFSAIFGGSNNYHDILASSDDFYINADVNNTGAGNLIFRNGGSSERMRIDSSGNVGIGTTSPGYALDVKTSAETACRLDSGSGNNAILRFAQAGVNKAFIQYPNGGGLTFGPAGSEAARIDSSGNVGIGTSSPSAKLDVSGVIRSSGSTGKYTNLVVDSAGSYIDASHFTQFRTNGASSLVNAMRIDSSGNVGIGTTSPQRALVVSDAGTEGFEFYPGSSSGNNTVNHYNRSTASFVNIITTADQHIFGRADGEKVRIDSSGRLLVGTTSAIGGIGAGARLQVKGNTSAAGAKLSLQRDQAAGSTGVGEEIGQLVFSSNDGGDYALITARTDGASSSTSDCPGRIEFSTTADGASSPTERMRITSDGYFKASNTGSYLNTNPGYLHEFWQSDAAFPSLRVGANNASYTGQVLQLRASRNTSNASFYYLSCYNEGSSTYRLYIADSGNVTNVNNSYGAISDIKLKENIVDANSQWSDIKALQVRNYNFIEGQTHTQLGLIAQEVELISPGLVTESPDTDEEGNDLGTVTKSVNYSVLYMKAVKALQEAMERIETLEQRLSDAGIA